MIGALYFWFHYFLWVREGSLIEKTCLLSLSCHSDFSWQCMSPVSSIIKVSIMLHVNWNWEVILVPQRTSAARPWELCHEQVSVTLSSTSFCLSASPPTTSVLPDPLSWVFSLSHSCRLLLIFLLLLWCITDQHDLSGLALPHDFSAPALIAS